MTTLLMISLFLGSSWRYFLVGWRNKNEKKSVDVERPSADLPRGKKTAPSSFWSRVKPFRRLWSLSVKRCFKEKFNHLCSFNDVVGTGARVKARSPRFDSRKIMNFFLHLPSYFALGRFRGWFETIGLSDCMISDHTNGLKGQKPKLVDQSQQINSFVPLDLINWRWMILRRGIFFWGNCVSRVNCCSFFNCWGLQKKNCVMYHFIVHWGDLNVADFLPLSMNFYLNFNVSGDN